MTDITEVAISDVRCFAGNHRVTLPRVTLLVGENSTGKSTFLACHHALSNIVHNPERDYDPFNRGPFAPATFANMARNGNSSFELGCRAGSLDHTIKFARRTGGGITERMLKVGNDEIGTLSLGLGRGGKTWKATGSNFAFEFERARISFPEFSVWLGLAVREGNLPFGGAPTAVAAGVKREQLARLLNFLRALSAHSQFPRHAVHAVSPDERVKGGPQDAHPLFPRLTGDRDAAAALVGKVRSIGRKIGLLSDLRVVRQGGRYSLEVKVQGQHHDVGLVGKGVPCILPLLSRLAENPARTFLLQQPETHLHPQAEASLAQLMAKSSSRFVVETHSDFILMRMQTCLRKGVLRPSEVKILWFETKGSRNRIHEIHMDEVGNILDAPARYRDFFIQETHDHLGLE